MDEANDGEVTLVLEVRVDGLLNEYAKSMKLHNLKPGESFFEVYVITILEILEDPRKVELVQDRHVWSIDQKASVLEAEMKPPGRISLFSYPCAACHTSRFAFCNQKLAPY